MPERAAEHLDLVRAQRPGHRHQVHVEPQQSALGLRRRRQVGDRRRIGERDLNAGQAAHLGQCRGALVGVHVHQVAVNAHDPRRLLARLGEAEQLDAVERVDGQAGSLHDGEPEQQDHRGARREAAGPEV